ncbi:MAG TPA: hypothetical protein VI256_07770, partial [Roseiarcus sp.]
FRIVSCGMGLDGLGPGSYVRLGGARPGLPVDIFPAHCSNEVLNRLDILFNAHHISPLFS